MVSREYVLQEHSGAAQGGEVSALELALLVPSSTPLSQGVVPCTCSSWIPSAALGMDARLHLPAEAPVLLKPFLARLGHAWCPLGSARHTQMQTQPQACSRQLRDFQCLQWPRLCQSRAAVPWERELAVDLVRARG